MNKWIISHPMFIVRVGNSQKANKMQMNAIHVTVQRNTAIRYIKYNINGKMNQKDINRSAALINNRNAALINYRKLI